LDHVVAAQIRFHFQPFSDITSLRLFRKRDVADSSRARNDVRCIIKPTETSEHACIPAWTTKTATEACLDLGSSLPKLIHTCGRLACSRELSKAQGFARLVQQEEKKTFSEYKYNERR